MCSSLDGSHSLAITNTAAICAHGTASRPAGKSSAHSSSSRSARHSVHPSQTSPNARVRSTRSPLSRTATVCSPVAVSSNSSCCSLPPVSCCASRLARARPAPSSSPRCTDGGGEPPPHMIDLDGDNKMELVQATAAGRIYAFRADGSQLPGFPVVTNPARNVVTHLAAPVFASGAIAPPAPTTTSRPAIGDLDHDGFPEIVYANIEGDVYVFRHDGTPFPGFPVRIDPA